MADSRTPDAIQREIEATRAELAGTIDAIADRVSPKKAASRGVKVVKEQVSAAVGQVSGTASDVSEAWGSASSDGDGRELRTDRVLFTVGAAAVAVAGIVMLRGRKH